MPALSITSGRSSRHRERSQLKSDPPDDSHSKRRRAVVPPLTRPSLAYERDLLLKGARRIAGIDEAGRGALAGPVAAAAVVLPGQPVEWFEDVDDSKRLTQRERERLAKLILRDAAVGVVMVPPSDIDSRGIAASTRLAMTTALGALGGAVDGLLVDGFELPEAGDLLQTALIHGDQVSLSIASASIIAKVARDAAMRELDTQFPGYGLGRNKGYGTALHMEALRRLGPSAIHRQSFRNVAGEA